VSIRVAPGAQYWADIGAAFPIPAGTITPGSLVIESSSGVLGDVSFGEARYRLWSSLAIVEPTASLVVPLVSNQPDRPMVVVVSNAGAAGANVNLRVLNAAGSETGSARLTIPAGGLSYDLLTAKVPASAGQTGGYLRLDSDQPVTAVALIGSLTQATDILAIPATSSTGAVTGPVAGPATPSISVSTQSLNFGAVTLSQPPTTMKFTIGNTGQADLRIRSITPSGSSSFSLVPAFAALKGRAEALYVCGDALITNNRIRIITLALGTRLATMYPSREHVDAGGLMSYGPNFPDMHRRAADYVDKILRGAKPADIPVEQPTKFDFVINLTTAKVLGVEIPSTLLARADEVIE